VVQVLEESFTPEFKPILDDARAALSAPIVDDAQEGFTTTDGALASSAATAADDGHAQQPFNAKRCVCVSVCVCVCAGGGGGG
jgi:hypothetical protein